MTANPTSPQDKPSNVVDLAAYRDKRKNTFQVRLWDSTDNSWGDVIEVRRDPEFIITHIYGWNDCDRYWHGWPMSGDPIDE